MAFVVNGRDRSKLHGDLRLALSILELLLHDRSERLAPIGQRMFKQSLRTYQRVQGLVKRGYDQRRLKGLKTGRRIPQRFLKSLAYARHSL